MKEASPKSNWQIAVTATDTVWGLIAKPNKENIERIYQIKGRDKNKPLIIFAKSITKLKELSLGWDPKIEAIAREHFPGALTIVMKRSSKLDSFINPEIETIGMRIPDSKQVLDLINDNEFLLSTSANLSGQEPVANYQEAQTQFSNQVDLVIDSQQTSSGEASTIISYIDGKIEMLRQGQLSQSLIGNSLHSAS